MQGVGTAAAISKWNIWTTESHGLIQLRFKAYSLFFHLKRNCTLIEMLLNWFCKKKTERCKCVSVHVCVRARARARARVCVCLRALSSDHIFSLSPLPSALRYNFEVSSGVLVIPANTTGQTSVSSLRDQTLTLHRTGERVCVPYIVHTKVSYNHAVRMTAMYDMRVKLCLGVSCRKITEVDELSNQGQVLDTNFTILLVHHMYIELHHYCLFTLASFWLVMRSSWKFICSCRLLFQYQEIDALIF